MSKPRGDNQVRPPPDAIRASNGSRGVASPPVRYRLVLAPADNQGGYDFRATLQRRLQLFATVAAAGLGGWIVLGFIRWQAQWLADPWSAITRPPGYGKALPLLLIECGSALLLTWRYLSSPRLRLVEWVIVIPLAIFFADKDCMNIGRVTLDELSWNQGTFANDSAQGWLLLMVGYGVLIPNTWQRCAAVVGMMALAALIPSSIALAAKGMPAIPAAQYVGLKSISLVIAALIVVYGAHRIQFLQEKLRSTLFGDLTHVGGPAPARLTDAFAVPICAGRYRLDGEIKRGGMGTIFQGYDTELGRDVAVKVLLEKHHGNPKLVQRFLEEARITALLQHPGVVPIYEVGQLADLRPYFAMQLVHGATLEKLLAKRQAPAQDLPHFLKVFELVCQTMAYAHTQGVIHRDLKPDNVMVGAFGEVMVMDWGIAKVLAGHENIDDVMAAPTTIAACDGARTCWSEGADLTNTAAEDTLPGAILGTIAYMSPEQAGGKIDLVDERSDVFTLGAILSVILTGQPPYTGSAPEQVYDKAKRADLADTYCRLDACGADRRLVALAKHCLSPASCERPRSAEEVLREITAYLEAIFKQPARDLVQFFELSLDLFCIAGLDGYFRRVNANFSRVLGYTDQELVSRPFVDFVHPDDLEKTAAEVTKLSRGLPVVHFQNRYRDVHGNYRLFDWMAKAIPADGVIFAVARDVTDSV